MARRRTSLRKTHLSIPQLAVHQCPSSISVCRKSAVETAEGWYTRARKQRRAGKSLEPLIEATSGDSAYLREVQASLEQLAGNEDAVVNQDLAALQGIQVR